MSKRRPVFFFAFYILIIFTIAVMTANKGWPVYLPLLFLILVPLVEFLFFREIFFPYHINCQSCKKRLSMDNIFVDADYLCNECKIDNNGAEEKEKEES